MISMQELALQYDRVSSLKVGAHQLAVAATRSPYPRPVSVALQFRTWCGEEKAFTEERFEPRSKTLQPVLDYLCFQGISSVCVLLGLKLWLVFHENAEQPTARIELHRKDADDRGFYRMQAIEQPFGAVLIYEGGLVALSSSGGELWHHRKCWDDEFLHQEGEKIVLLRESRERELINVMTGESHVSIN